MVFVSLQKTLILPTTYRLTPVEVGDCSADLVQPPDGFANEIRLCIARSVIDEHQTTQLNNVFGVFSVLLPHPSHGEVPIHHGTDEGSTTVKHAETIVGAQPIDVVTIVVLLDEISNIFSANWSNLIVNHDGLL